MRMEDGFTLQPTETGRLMARYYVAFESMKRFLALTGREDLSVLVGLLMLYPDIHLSQAIPGFEKNTNASPGLQTKMGNLTRNSCIMYLWF